MKPLDTALLASSLVLAGSALAAGDGVVGDASAGSTGTAIVRIVKEEAVRITKVDDIEFGNQASLVADALESNPVCVFASTGGYDITASGDGPGGTFLLSDGGGGFLPYAVSWIEDGTAVPLTPGATASGFVGDLLSDDCGGPRDVNAIYEITIDRTDFNAAATGIYTGTLTLEMMPE